MTGKLYNFGIDTIFFRESPSFNNGMSDITWIQAFQVLLQMFRTMLSDNTELSDEKINELANAFIDALPALLKTKLQAA